MVRPYTIHPWLYPARHLVELIGCIVNPTDGWDSNGQSSTRLAASLMCTASGYPPHPPPLQLRQPTIQCESVRQLHGTDLESSLWANICQQSADDIINSAVFIARDRTGQAEGDDLHQPASDLIDTRTICHGRGVAIAARKRSIQSSVPGLLRSLIFFVFCFYSSCSLLATWLLR